jgi:hypothetical protein
MEDLVDIAMATKRTGAAVPVCFVAIITICNVTNPQNTPTYISMAPSRISFPGAHHIAASVPAHSPAAEKAVWIEEETVGLPGNA